MEVHPGRREWRFCTMHPFRRQRTTIVQRMLVPVRFKPRRLLHLMPRCELPLLSHLPCSWAGNLPSKITRSCGRPFVSEVQCCLGFHYYIDTVSVPATPACKLKGPVGWGHGRGCARYKRISVRMRKACVAFIPRRNTFARLIHGNIRIASAWHGRGFQQPYLRVRNRCLDKPCAVL